jgi:signal transduction histidine kinase
MGVLSIHREKQQQLFRAEEVELLTSIADHVGVLVESAQLRHLAQQAAVMEERARLARDLHDSVSQLLYSLTLFAEVGQESYRLGELEQVNDTLTELGEVSQQALKEMRLLIYELRPSALELEGLIGALQQRLDTVEGRAGVEAHLLVENMMELPKALEEELYLLAHEALNNTLKHAKATRVTVRIGADDRFVELEISDNGLGFDPRAVNGGGLGLISMRERAERLGGTLSLQSWPEEGTTVKVRVKIQAARPQSFSMLPKP